MSRPPKYKPVIEQVIRDHPDGITTRDITTEAGCSIQQTYKVVKQLKDEGRIAVVGQSDAGGDLLAWGQVFVPDVVATGSAVVRIGERYTVTGARLGAGGELVVTLVDSHGNELEVPGFGEASG